MILRLLILTAITMHAVSGQDCDPGWKLYELEATCAQPIYAKRMTKNNAQDYCSSLNANLVMILNEPKNTWVTSLISDEGTVYWIGLSDRGSLQWKWVDNTPAEYFNWAPGEPNENDGLHEDCVEMYSSGYWNDEQCLGLAYPICERAVGLTGPPPTTPNYEPPCPLGWYKYEEEQCLLLVTERRDTFNSAREYCRTERADLVMIKTEALNNFIVNLISRYDDDEFWIGLTDRREMYEFLWIDETPLQEGDYTNWAPGEPNESDGLHEDCVEIYAHTGKWNDEQCVAYQNYICSRPTVFKSTTPGPSTTPRPTHPPALSPECGDGWMKYQETCVLIVGQKSTFNIAQEYCQERHANLIKLESQDMNNWLVDQTAPYNQVFWIGLYDRIEDNTFVWTDGTEPSFTNWAPGNPNNYDGIGEDCVEMYTAGTWNDEQCLALNAFACSKGFEEIPKCDIKDGWESSGEKCYRWISDTKSFYEATDYCSSMDGYIISINTEEEQTFATSIQLRHANIQYWIGLTDEGNRNTFTWQDGTSTGPQDYTNWDENQPNSDVYPACGMIQGPYPDVWSVDQCNERKRFICEKPQGTCADGWVLHGGECYQFNALKRTWTDASYYCSTQGGWLGTILDGAENTFIASQMGPLYEEQVYNMWIGYSDIINDGQWQWVHETRSTYENWPKQPTNTYGQADCAYLYTDDQMGLWNQMLCTLLAGFFCKIKAGSTVTPVTAPDKVGSCDRGWGLYGDWCYYIPNVEKNFADAESECAALFSGSHLASIHSIGEQSFITERLKYINAWTWIGLNDRDIEDTWKWTDGTNYDFWNWAEGEPNNVNNEDCVHLGYFDDHQIGLWNDNNCNDENRYICKKAKYNTPPVTEAPPITLPPSGRCGSNWVFDAGSNNCFKYATDKITWPKADEQCHYEGGLLTSITNQADSAFHHQNALYYALNYNAWNFWIGLHDTNMESGYEWSDGAPVSYLNWNPGEPNDYNTGEDYVEMLSETGKWNDHNGEYTAGYICKRNSFVTDQFKVFPNSRLDETSSTPISNVWPEDCAIFCYSAGQDCRSFNYYRKNRECTLLAIDQYSDNADLVPEFEDPYDYYERDFNGPAVQVPTTIDPSYGCNKVETGYRSYCYSLVTSVSSFNGMQDVCALRSADLVSIADASEMNFVTSLMQTGNTGTTRISSVWLGLNDMDREGTYAWTDGSEITYTKWAAGQPQNTENDDDCIVHNIDMDGWLDNVCTGNQHYGVCKSPKRTSNVVQPENEGCPIGWLKYMSSCYELVTDQKIWIDAKADCLNKNGRLAIINDKYEQAYLASLMGAIYFYTFDYWIGLSDTDIPGTYLWVDGSHPTLSAWAPTQPDPYLGDCVALVSAGNGAGSNVAGLWFDERCYKEHNYICERPVDGTTDTPYTQAPVTNPSNIGCTDDNAIGYGSNCFIPFERNPIEQISWASARTYCRGMGGDLASFQSKEEEAYIVSHYIPIDPETAKYGFWTGLNDQSRESGFQWSDGSPLVYLNWESGEPNDYSGSEDCGEMYFSGRGWNDLSCSATRSFLCKVPKQIKAPTTIPPIRECLTASGWQYFEPYCYYFSDVAGSNDRLSWTQAEDFCNQKGGHLASIMSSAENAALMEMAPTIGINYWIGIHQEVAAGSFRWSDGSPYTYENWDRGEPNNHNGEELCGEIYRYNGLQQNGVWNDAACGVNTPFICKKMEESVNPITRAPTEAPVGGCSDGYFKYFNRCYRMGGYEETDRYSWEDSRSVCQGEGGNLVGIHSQPVQSLLASMLLDIEGDVWIGFSDEGSNGQYHWTDGKPAVYVNWFPGEPTGHISLPGAPARNCVEMLNTQWYAGMWSDSECSNAIGYICERDLDPQADDNPPEEKYCDDPSYYKYGDSCFKLDTTRRSYDGAQEFCENDGGNLASITDAHYEAFLEYLLYSRGVSDAWIGMEKIDGQYQWADGWPVFVSFWGDGEPSQNEGEGCVIITDKPSWDDTSCTELHPTLCRTTNAKPPEPVEELPGYCQSDQTSFGGNCYYVPNEFVFVEWQTARYQCQQMGGDLASIHSKEENEFIRKLVQTRIGKRNVWIGLERGSSGGFTQWNDGSPVDYVQWDNGEPTNDWRGTQENCVEIYTNDYGTWKDEVCNTGSSFICKFPKYDNSTSQEPVGQGLSGGAIAGIVISCVLVVTVILLVIGYMMGMRSVPKLGTSSTSATSSGKKDTIPTPASGFDNVVYSPDSNQKTIQLDSHGSVA
ncbi:macrophage mannose receptor 1-like isoform X1 [Lytechinus variegatus]|uniref:macrophage mannose receptor 1-like isoform X1 n=1 Tax=Lytechinus variegatus TaxID=7654 RepID=UPI001BB260A8|nr:macrophage mannose receptor 1-like isoform X1 [Lytechinus variegatus]